ncbi:hypothetical protein DC498_10500 [Terrimonas sp.]|nr:hypothetical protein DC498_10500 [Terrimonas sp.]
MLKLYFKICNNNFSHIFLFDYIKLCLLLNLSIKFNSPKKLTMNLTAAIGKSIRHYRLLKSIKLETLAKQIEVSKATMSQIENGQVEITISRIEKIAKALEVEYTTLITVKNGNIKILNKPLDQESADYNLNVDKTIIEKILNLTEEVMKLKTNE